MAEFGFDGAIVFMGVFHDLAGDLGIFLEWLVAGVNHHAGETFIKCTVCTDRRCRHGQGGRRWDIGQADRRLDEFFEIDRRWHNWRAPLEIWRINGAFSSSQASTMAWMSSILFDVERAERVFALQRLMQTGSLEYCVSGIGF